MADVLMIDGKPEIIMNDRDFSYILDKHLGVEIAEYFEAALENATAKARDSPNLDGKCECDKLYELQSHYEGILHDVMDEISEWKTAKLTKAEIDSKRLSLIMKINSEL